jgi:tripartite ATP-independent transporter DctM subunit
MSASTPDVAPHGMGSDDFRKKVSGERDMFSFMDHISRFTGFTVAQFYIICAAVTLYEVIARYVFDAPTQWAFEVVMVLCATAWMLSSGYITLEKRHIGITVIYVAVGERARWWLDLLAMSVGVVALFFLVDDTLVRALESIDLVERMGSGFNSPQPMILKTVLALGAFIYMVQLLVNLYRHFASSFFRSLVMLVGGLILFRLLMIVIQHYTGDDSIAGTVNEGIAAFGNNFNPAEYVDAREWSIGMASLGIVVALVLLMMTGMPLGIVTLIVSVLVAMLYFGPRGLYLVSTNAFGLLEKYPLVAVPLFVLMASILERAGIAEDLFDAMSIFAGNLRGGVAVQTVVVAVILAAMSGVMGGEIVMLGLVALPQMLRLGYNKHLAIGVICASGSLATLIPPSIIMIVYGLSAEVSIGDLFMAGATPGIMLATFYALFVLARCKMNPDLAPTAEEVEAITGRKSGLSRERLLAVIMCIVLIGCVMGSIYAGIASVTEAAGVGVFGAILVAAVRMQFNWSLLQHALAGTMSTVGTIIWLILGAVAFVGIYNLIGGADFMKSLFTGLGLPPMGIIFVMMGILIVLGTFMEWIAIVFITVPVFAPVVVDMAPELGLDPEWAAVLPFIGLQIIGLALVMIFPQIALWLPQWMGSS